MTAPYERESAMNIFRKLREQKGMPAAALDERFQIQHGDWDSWENGFKKPEPELLEEIAEYFGVSVKELEE